MLLSPGPDLQTALQDYFRQRLAEFSESLQPKPQEDTLWYLGHMLARFGNSDQLFSYDNGAITLRPLALLYNDALNAETSQQRCLQLRQLGDLALFLGALFPDNYARRGIHKDYFVGMGGGAYDYLSENARTHRHIFAELATSFSRALQLIANACSKDHVFDANDVIALYNQWRKTQNPALAKQLRELGIDLPPTPKAQ